MNATTKADATTWHDRDLAHVMQTYARSPLAFSHGQGTALFDLEGRPYLDFLCGLAVTNLGHAHPAVTEAIATQAGRLMHTSNLFLTEPMLELAERLADIVGWADARTFFANCGATANEAALKLARRWGKRRDPAKTRVVTLSGSFHGRTMATLEATGQPTKHEPFAPLLGYVDTVPFDDAESLRSAVTDRHCAVLLEIVQGEGGVRPVPEEVLHAAREACDRHDALLLVDEVQTGMGRTGEWFAFHGTDVVPDVVTVAKALANGLPIGACIARGEAGTVFEPGDHATTFGGNPVTAAAACAVIDTIERDGLLRMAKQRGARLVEGVQAMAEEVPLVTGIRGVGLLLGVTLSSPVARAVERACRERFLIVNAVADDVVRLAPPLNVSDDEIDLALSALAEACQHVEGLS